MGTQFLQFENIALNINYTTRKDNDGIIIEREQTIIKNGEIAYKSTLPFESISTALKKYNIPIIKSFFAGTYLCNNIFYHLMHFARKYKIPHAGFIHVPPTPECFKNYRNKHLKIEETNFNLSKITPTYSCINYPSMTFSTLKKAIELIVKVCIEFVK